MKTLVIHPKDATTDFLCEIYKNIDCEVVRNDISSAKLKQLIREHDIIMMMGHGTAQGLLGFNKLVINSTFVNDLKDKPFSVYIWCNANEFVQRYNLKGFNTGMIISEVEEAIYCGLNERFSVADIEYSNKRFAFVIKEAIELNIREEKFNTNSIQRLVKSNYNDLYNPIIKYNNERIYNIE